MVLEKALNVGLPAPPGTAVALIVDDLGDKPCVLQRLCNAFNSGFTKVTKILRVEHVAVIACATAVDNFMTVPEAHCYDIASIDPKVGEAFLESVIYPMVPAGALHWLLLKPIKDPSDAS